MKFLRHLFIFAIAFALIGRVAFAQGNNATNYSLAVQPQKNLPGFEGINVWKDIEYANVDGHSLKLDLYIPENISHPAPLIIDIHGGGWMALGKNEMVAGGIRP